MSTSAAPLRKLVLLGTGLIAGSFALALRRAGLVTQVVGVDCCEYNLQRALEYSVIDVASLDAATAVQGADLVFLGTPVGQMGKLMQAIAPHLAADCIVTDAGSTKQDVCDLYRAHLAGHLAQCVPAHPIAGSAQSGAAAASSDLYEGRRLVLTPLPQSSSVAVERVRVLWQACGAEVCTMTAAEHDAIFAAVSHTPQLLAYAYMNAVLDNPDAARCLDFAATGFRDFTRIAGSNPDMWRDIALANRGAILAELRQSAARIDELIVLIESADGPGMRSFFERASVARNAWNMK